MVFFQCFGMEVPKLTAKTYPNSTKIDCSLSLSPNTYHNKSYDGDYSYKQKVSALENFSRPMFQGGCENTETKLFRKATFCTLGQ